MAQLIKPGAVKVLTKEGEVAVTIAIELTVNLNAEGLQVNSQVKNISSESVASKEDQKAESTYWEVPDFDLGPKVDFGKKI
jgi:hypothetical protein